MAKMWKLIIVVLLAAAVITAFSLRGDGDKPPADNAVVQDAPASSPAEKPEPAEPVRPETKPAVATPKAEPEKASVKTEEPATQPEKVAPKPKRLPRIVDVGGDNCIPCKLMAPILDELRAEYKGKLEVVVISLDKDPGAGKRYRISTIPTQILYGTDGKEFARHFGFYAKEDIVAAFKKQGIEL